MRRRLGHAASPPRDTKSARLTRGFSRASLAFAGLLLGVIALGLAFVFDEALAGVGIAPGQIVLLAVLLVAAVTCGRDPLHPARLLAVLLAIGFIIGPIVHALTDFYALPGGAARQRANLDEALWMLVAGAALAMLSMRAVLGGAWASQVRPALDRPIRGGSLVAAGAVAIVGLMALLGYLAFMGRSGVLLENAEGTYTQLSGEGRKAYLNLLAPIALGGLFTGVAVGLERGARKLALTAAVLALMTGALLAVPGSRANVLYGVVPLIFIYAYYRRLPRLRSLIPILALVVVALLYGTSLRNAETRSMLIDDPGGTLVNEAPTPRDVKAFFLVDVAHTEPLLGAMDAYPSVRPFVGGESFALGATGPVGWKFATLIDLEAEPIAGVTFTAAAYGDDPSTFGSGLTATLPGELYASGGPPILLLGLAAFGALAGWIRLWAVRSSARGKIVLYAAALTTVFAIFADYSGQFYRGGAVLAGAIFALAIVDRSDFRFIRMAVIGLLGAAAVGTCLAIRRWGGDPPGALFESMVPVYVACAGIALYLVVHLVRLHHAGGLERMGLNLRGRAASETP